MKSYVKSLVKRILLAVLRDEFNEINARIASIEITTQSLVSAFLATHQKKLKN